MQKYGDRVNPHVHSALLRMHFCRSSDLGKRVYRCDSCDHESTVFNSCGDRNCPQCSGAKRSNWLNSTLSLTTPQATYFQVVFTLPQELSSLTLGNRTEIYNLLFETAWLSLQKRVEKDLGIQASGVAVLHTWNQRLGHHPHIHMMVPGNGPSLDGSRWVDVRIVWSRKRKQMEPFLVDNKILGKDFQKLFLDRLAQKVEEGKVELEESCSIADLISKLRDEDWVVFIEGPPTANCPPSRMIKYLTRYLTGGPISDRRIVGEKNGRIYFMARSKDKRKGQVETSLSKVEFVQQWCLHILPKDFTKTRFFGHWSGSKRKEYMARCNSLAPSVSTPSAQSMSPNTAANTQTKPMEKKQAYKPKCPHCQEEMACVAKQNRPKWRELFYGPAHPRWYEWTSQGLCSPSDDGPEPLVEPETNEALSFDIFDQQIALDQQTANHDRDP